MKNCTFKIDPLFKLWKRSFKSADPKLLTEDDMKKYVAKGTKYVSMPILKLDVTKLFLMQVFTS